MNALIERPNFYEGQILGAADLEADAAHARGQLARHERYLHLWGIAQGLQLNAKDKQTAKGEKYQEITLTAGIAVDGTGREIVVPEDTLLSEDLFDQLNVAIQDDAAWYPVFLEGYDAAAPLPVLAPGACGSLEPTRVMESYNATFGRPGDERLEENNPSAVADGPGGTSVSDRWPVLLGFVQWDKTLRKFKAAAPDAAGLRRRYAGVQADQVAARAGELSLRTRGAVEKGKPALVMDETTGGLLRFGLLTSQGSLTTVFSVNAKGDLTATGKIAGALTTGGVQAESGLISDGMTLPLPPGITEAQVSAGEAVVHAQVALQLTPADRPDPAKVWGAFPLETYVDTARRVHCLVRWFELNPINLAQHGQTIEDRPGVCAYTVLAAVRATGGGSP